MENGRDEPEMRFNQVVMKKWPELSSNPVCGDDWDFKSKVEQWCDLNPQGWAEKSESWDLNQVVVEKWPKLRFKI
jgi:hypothetical protein